MYRLCISRKHPYPQSLGRLMEIPSGRRGFKTKRFKRKYVAKPEFSGGGCSNLETFHGRDVDIFWNNTLA